MARVPQILGSCAQNRADKMPEVICVILETTMAMVQLQGMVPELTRRPTRTRTRTTARERCGGHTTRCTTVARPVGRQWLEQQASTLAIAASMVRHTFVRQEQYYGRSRRHTVHSSLTTKPSLTKRLKGLLRTVGLYSSCSIDSIPHPPAAMPHSPAAHLPSVRRAASHPTLQSPPRPVPPLLPCPPATVFVVVGRHCKTQQEGIQQGIQNSAPPAPAPRSTRPCFLLSSLIVPGFPRCGPVANAARSSASSSPATRPHQPPELRPAPSSTPPRSTPTAPTIQR